MVPFHFLMLWHLGPLDGREHPSQASQFLEKANFKYKPASPEPVPSVGLLYGATPHLPAPTGTRYLTTRGSTCAGTCDIIHTARPRPAHPASRTFLRKPQQRPLCPLSLVASAS